MIYMSGFRIGKREFLRITVHISSSSMLCGFRLLLLAFKYVSSLI